jgi:hypothetical protein
VEAIGPSKVLGTVLNRAKRPSIAGHYRYGYSYSYRYTPQEARLAKKGWTLPFRRKR